MKTNYSYSHYHQSCCQPLLSLSPAPPFPSQTLSISRIFGNGKWLSTEVQLSEVDCENQQNNGTTMLDDGSSYQDFILLMFSRFVKESAFQSFSIDPLTVFLRNHTFQFVLNLECRFIGLTRYSIIVVKCQQFCFFAESMASKNVPLIDFCRYNYTISFFCWDTISHRIRF